VDAISWNTNPCQRVAAPRSYYSRFWRHSLGAAAPVGAPVGKCRQGAVEAILAYGLLAASQTRAGAADRAGHRLDSSGCMRNFLGLPHLATCATSDVLGRMRFAMRKEHGGLPDGRVVEGLLCTSSSRPGFFWVEYNGRRKTDGSSCGEPTWTEEPEGDPVRADQRGFTLAMAPCAIPTVGASQSVAMGVAMDCDMRHARLSSS
jgi:hypothetical protein